MASTAWAGWLAEEINCYGKGEILEIARREATEYVEHPPSPEELRELVGYIRESGQRRSGPVMVG